MKIKINNKTKEELLKDLKDKDVHISSYAQELIDKLDFSKPEKEVEYEIKTLKELGFAEGYVRTSEFMNDGFLKKHNLELCPPELALYMIASDKNGYAYIAMEPISASDGVLSVFRVEHDDYDRWLGASRGRPGYRWDAGYRWVFVRPRKIVSRDSGHSSLPSEALPLEKEIGDAISLLKSEGFTVTKQY